MAEQFSKASGCGNANTTCMMMLGKNVLQLHYAGELVKLQYLCVCAHDSCTHVMCTVVCTGPQTSLNVLHHTHPNPTSDLYVAVYTVNRGLKIRTLKSLIKKVVLALGCQRKHAPQD